VIFVHKIREIARGEKIRELAHSGDSVVLHSSRREVLLFLLRFLRTSTRDYDGEAVSSPLQTYGRLYSIYGFIGVKCNSKTLL
jgi:hypothetical protein